MKLIVENWKRFLQKEQWELDDQERAWEEEERRFKAGEDNPWKQGSTLNSDELRAMADKMDQSAAATGDSQFSREEEMQMSDAVEEFIKKNHSSIVFSERELYKLNRVMDGLWDGNLPKNEIPGIAKALQKGDQGLIDYFKIEMS
jgi:hypothetical protein